MRTKPEIFEAIKQHMIDEALERVKDSWKYAEADSNKICRVCLIGASWEARKSGKITFAEEQLANNAIHATLRTRCDWASTLRTIPDRAAMFALFDEAAKL